MLSLLLGYSIMFMDFYQLNIDKIEQKHHLIEHGGFFMHFYG